MHLQLILSITWVLAPIVNAQTEWWCRKHSSSEFGPQMFTSRATITMWNRTKIMIWYGCPEPSNIKCSFLIDCIVTNGDIGYGVRTLMRNVQPAFWQGAAQDGLIFSAVEKRTNRSSLATSTRIDYLSLLRRDYALCLWSFWQCGRQWDFARKPDRYCIMW